VASSSPVLPDQAKSAFSETFFLNLLLAHSAGWATPYPTMLGSSLTFNKEDDHPEKGSVIQDAVWVDSPPASKFGFTWSAGTSVHLPPSANRSAQRSPTECKRYSHIFCCIHRPFFLQHHPLLNRQLFPALCRCRPNWAIYRIRVGICHLPCHHIHWRNRPQNYLTSSSFLWNWRLPCSWSYRRCSKSLQHKCWTHPRNSSPRVRFLSQLLPYRQYSRL